MPPPSTPLRVLLTGLLGFLAVLGAYVALALTGNDTTAFLTFLGTLAAVAGLGVHNEVRSRPMRDQVAKIDQQTNGILDARIEHGVRAALLGVGLPTLDPTPEQPAPEVSDTTQVRYG